MSRVTPLHSQKVSPGQGNRPETRTGGPFRDARLQALQQQIRQLERRDQDRHPVLPLGIPAIDQHLPWGGLPLGQIHQFLAPGQKQGGLFTMAPVQGFTAALMGLLTRQKTGPVIYCQPAPSARSSVLYEPGLRAFGLTPDQIIFVRSQNHKDLLWAMEDALQSRVPLAVVGLIDRLNPVAARRLQLAAESGGTTGFLLGFEGQCTAALPTATRWRITAQPSRETDRQKNPDSPWRQGHWQLDLIRGRGASPKSWSVIWDGCPQPRDALPLAIFQTRPHDQLMESFHAPRTNSTQAPIPTTANRPDNRPDNSPLASERKMPAFRLAATDDPKQRPTSGYLPERQAQQGC